MKKDDKAQKRYSLGSNLAFVFAHVLKWDRGYFRAYAASIPAAVLTPLALLYFPKLLIDLIEGRASELQTVLTITLCCACLYGLETVQTWSSTRTGAAQYSFSLSMQALLTQKNMRTDFSNTEHPKVNTLFDKAANESHNAESVLHTVKQLSIQTLGIFTYGGMLALLSPLVLTVLIISAAINFFVLRAIRNYSERKKDSWIGLDRKTGYLSRLISEFTNAKDIRLYDMSGWLFDTLRNIQGERMQWHRRVSLRELLGRLSNAALRLVRDGAAYAVLITMLLRQQIGAGDFVLYFGAVAGLSGWLSSIVGNFNSLFQDNISIGYVREYLDLPEQFNHGEGVPLPPQTELPPEIEFKHVSLRYPKAERDAVADFNFTIRRGERIAIVGENGAGKTTLVKMLCGLYLPTGGDVLLCGRPITDYNIEEYYTLISAVFQDIHMLPFPISQYVSSSDGDNCDRDKVMNVLRFAELLDKTDRLPHGVDTVLVKGVFEDAVDLSGGEQQKLVLARALYKDAPVIVLDEPTAALDPIAESELYEKYADLTRGKTSVYISHRLASTRFCDRILFLENGRLAECGSHAELIALCGKYAHMYELQSHYYKEEVKDA